jgi:hypothetical protein
MGKLRMVLLADLKNLEEIPQGKRLTVVEKIAPGETKMRSVILVRFVSFSRHEN